MKTFDEYRAQFATLYGAVKEDHALSAHRHRGHGLDHDVTVAQMAAYLAPSQHLAEMVWVAGLIHSTDRLLGGASPTEKLREYLTKLPGNLFSKEESEEIFLAALEHSEKMPSHRSPTQEILQDADKLVNMQAAMLIRVGQFRHDMPALELQYLDHSNPQSTYHHPINALDNVRMVSEEYPPLLFTPKGKELGARYATALRSYQESIARDYDLLGLKGAIL